MGDVMRKELLLLSCLVGSLSVAGCNKHPDNLLFVDTNVLGISAGGAGGAAFKLGFANVDYFSVPVVRENADGEPAVLLVDDIGGRTGTFSAIAIFDATAQGCLGKLAAVGFAAREVAKLAARRC